MKISNFKPLFTDTTRKGLNWELYATIDITTGILFWKKTVEYIICKNSGSAWQYVATGKYVDDREKLQESIISYYENKRRSACNTVTGIWLSKFRASQELIKMLRSLRQ